MIREGRRCVKLMDFGIAQMLDLAAHDRDRAAARLAGVHGARASSRASRSTSAPTCSRSASCSTSSPPGSCRSRARTRTRCCARIAEGKFADPRSGQPRASATRSRGSSRARWRASPRTAIPTWRRCGDELLAYLADAGLDDARARAARVLRRSEGVDRELPAAAHRVARPRAAARSPRRGAPRRRSSCGAARCSVEPRSPELRALVDGVARRRRVSRVALVGLCAIALGGAGTLGVRSWLGARAHSQTAPARPALRPSARDDFTASARAEHASYGAARAQGESAEGAFRDRQADRARRAEIAPRAPPDPRAGLAHHRSRALSRARFTSGSTAPIWATTPTTKYAIDSRPHSFRLECLSNACFPKTVQVGARAGARRRAARVAAGLSARCVTQPPGADVLVAGLPAVYNDRQPIAVEIPAMSDDGRRNVQVTVSPRDKHFVSQTIALTLRAGQQL